MLKQHGSCYYDLARKKKKGAQVKPNISLESNTSKIPKKSSVTTTGTTIIHKVSNTSSSAIPLSRKNVETHHMIASHSVLKKNAPTINLKRKTFEKNRSSPSSGSTDSPVEVVPDSLMTLRTLLAQTRTSLEQEELRRVKALQALAESQKRVRLLQTSLQERDGDFQRCTGELNAIRAERKELVELLETKKTQYKTKLNSYKKRLEQKENEGILFSTSKIIPTRETTHAWVQTDTPQTRLENKNVQTVAKKKSENNEIKDEAYHQLKTENTALSQKTDDLTTNLKTLSAQYRHITQQLSLTQALLNSDAFAASPKVEMRRAIREDVSSSCSS